MGRSPPSHLIHKKNYSAAPVSPPTTIPSLPLESIPSHTRAAAGQPSPSAAGTCPSAVLPDCLSLVLSRMAASLPAPLQSSSLSRALHPTHNDETHGGGIS
jgi:hypothetical protein